MPLGHKRGTYQSPKGTTSTFFGMTQQSKGIFWGLKQLGCNGLGG